MSIIDDIVGLAATEEWGEMIDGNAVVFFKYEFSLAEKVAFPGKTWRAGYINGNSCCILEFETEPTTGDVEALYS